jgi:hypothetical protein
MQASIRISAQAVSRRLFTAKAWVGFVVERVELEQIFLRVHWFPCQYIPPLLHIHSFIIWGMEN